MERPALLNSALIIPPLALALAAPGFALAAQDAASERPFPWPSFIHVEPAPGEYRMTMTLVEAALTNGGDGKAEQDLADAVDQPETRFQCFTGEQDRPDIMDAFGEDGCMLGDPVYDGDSFDLRMQCADPAGEIESARFYGTATPERMDMRITARIDDPAAGKIVMNMRVEIERVGDCE